MPPMPARPGPRSLLRVLGRRLPRTRGELRVSGIGEVVAIGRDRWGIPYVEAANDADAWFGLGFCHGQDRGFQLELLARAGRGTLAELLGRAALPIDRLSRTLGFRRIADAQLPMLDPDVRSGIDAYVAGVNAAATASPRPHELVLLRGRIAIRAEPHEPPERASAGVSKYGVVYLARDCVLNRDVAIKCVSSKRDRSRHPPTARPGSPLRRRPRPPIDLSRLRSVLE